MSWKSTNLRNAIDGILSLYDEHINEIKTIGDFYKFYDGRIDMKEISLISMLSNMTNAHVETVEDMIGCLGDLQTIMSKIDDNDIIGMLNNIGIAHADEDYGYSESEIAHMLNAFKPGKYKFEDRDRFYGLQTITDCDFIDYKGLNKENYELVYGILLNSYDAAGIYDSIAIKYNAIPQPVLRKSILLHWDKLFQRVIDGLEHCIDKSREKELRVYIPFLEGYEETASYTIEIFKMAQDITRLLRDTDCQDELAANNPDNLIKILPMKEMMEEYGESMLQEGFSDITEAVYIEMARRGLVKNVKWQTSSFSYLTDVVGKSKKVEDGNEEEVLSFEEATMNRKIAVVFHMLRGTNATTDIMHRVAHYLIHDDKEWKGTDNGKATIYNYLRRLTKNDPPFLVKQDDIEYVKKTLLKYGFKEEAQKI